MTTSDSPGGFWSTLVRRKPIDQIEDEQESGGLKRTLGLWQLTAIGVGGIIGAGIFALAGQVAHKNAGPSVLISFLIAGIASGAAALSYAEFAGLIPKAGSAYTYGYAVLGEFAGWFIGWDLLLEYTAIVAVVAISISGYFGYLLGAIGVDPPAWMMGSWDPKTGHVVDVFAIILCLFIAFLLTRGIKTAARFETIVVGIKIAIVLLVIVVGVFYVNTHNYTPFFPHGFTGTLTGASIVFFAVFGYDAMSTAAEESVESRKHMPKAIVYSLVISMVLYVLACLVLTGMQHYTKINPKSGFATAFESVGLTGLGSVIAVGAIIGIMTVLFTFMLAVTRVWYSMSRDRLLPKVFAKTSRRHRVPTLATWIVGGVSAAIAGFVPIGEAAELVNIGILLAFLVVCIAVIVLRYKRPNLPRTFRLPGMPVVPAIGAAASIWLITYLQPFTWLRFAVWFVIGLIIYLAYSRRNSMLNPNSKHHAAPVPPPAETEG